MIFSLPGRKWISVYLDAGRKRFSVYLDAARKYFSVYRTDANRFCTWTQMVFSLPGRKIAFSLPETDANEFQFTGRNLPGHNRISVYDVNGFQFTRTQTNFSLPGPNGFQFPDVSLVEFYS